MQDSVTVNQAIRILNTVKILSGNPEALFELFEYRVPCNKALAKHPTIHVCHERGQASISCITLINNFFGVDSDGWGSIAYAADYATHRILGFEHYSSEINKVAQVSECIKLLNEALQADPKAVNTLLDFRTQDYYSVLRILNMLFEHNNEGMGQIVAVSEEGSPEVVRFEQYNPQVHHPVK